MATNVLLVTVDSLRFDHLDVFQTSFDTGFDSFNAAYATGPGTSPSFPGILTGTFPLSCDGLGPLTKDRPRVAVELQEAGLRTGGFQCNPFLSTHFNYDVGYDTFEDYQNPLMGIATKIFPRGIEINNPKLRRIDETLHLMDTLKKTYQLVKGKPRPYVSAEVITDDTVDWLKDVVDPFFCWTHYMDVHHPCYPPEEYRTRFGVGDVTESEVSEWYGALISEPETLDGEKLEKFQKLYDAAIAYTDDQIGRIIETLIQTGQYEDTLVILTSDHGELFGEHGQYGKPERMYDELLHVPLVVANGPDYLEDATNDLVSLLDIPPLIHDALGVNVPEEYEGRIPGVDDPRNLVMAEHEVEGEVIVGARSQDWLYEGDEIDDEHRLFDLRDGFERVSIEDHAEASATVRQAVNDRLARLDVETHRLEDEVEGDVESRLEDLGYL